MRLYLLRHGQTDWNAAHKLQGQTDVPLNETGLKQAREEAKRREEAGITFDRVFSSPLSRAKETARIVSGLPEEEIQTDPRIMEMSFGVDDGDFSDGFMAEDEDGISELTDDELGGGYDDGIDLLD